MTDDELRDIIGEKESNVQNNVIDYLELQGYMVIRLNAGKARHNIRLAPPGTPDLLAESITDIWIEVKQPGKDLSDIQREVHARLIKNGKWVMTVHSLDELIKGVHEWEKASMNSKEEKEIIL